MSGATLRQTTQLDALKRSLLVATACHAALYLYLNFEMADVFIIAIVSIICVIITYLVIKIVTVKRAFWGFPEPKYDKHWLHGPLPHVCIHLYLSILSILCIFMYFVSRFFNPTLS